MARRIDMSIMGEAPKLFGVFAPVLAGALAASVAWPRAFDFLGKFRGVGFAAGIELAALGLPFWASAAFSLVRAYKAERLATRGAYGLCRNPIFSWWIYSVLPALGLCLDSWLILALAPALYLLARPSAKREEAELAARFGAEYEAYAERVRAFLPLPRLRPFGFGRYAKAALSLAAIGAMAVAVIAFAVAPMAGGLGATRDERKAAMAGDDIIGVSWTSYTQAITIEARAEAVWPWLAQVGYKRAGWYNFDAINRMADKAYFLDGSGSSTRIVPEFQALKLGDRIDIAPGFGFAVSDLVAPYLLAMGGDLENPMNPNNAAWTFSIRPISENRCRLVTRFRTATPATFGARLLNGFLNSVGGAIIQQPAMLAGLRARAERTVREQAAR